MDTDDALPPDGLTDGLTLRELCEDSGVSERTVRYYMQQGLLAPAARTGPGVRYPRAHLARLKLVRRWQDDYLPLEQIRKLLSDLPDAEAERLAASPASPASPATSASAPTAQTAADYVKKVLGRDPTPARKTPTERPSTEPLRSQWERFVLAEDIELHVRRPLSHVMNRRVEALLAEARKLLEPENHR